MTHLGIFVPPSALARLVWPVLGAHPHEHRNADDHEQDTQNKKSLAGFPCVELEFLRCVAVGAAAAGKAGTDLAQAIAMRRQTVQTHALEAGNHDGEEGKDEPAEPEGADGPRLVAAIVQHVGPGASRAEARGEQGALEQTQKLIKGYYSLCRSLRQTPNGAGKKGD